MDYTLSTIRSSKCDGKKKIWNVLLMVVTLLFPAILANSYIDNLARRSQTFGDNDATIFGFICNRL